LKAVTGTTTCGGCHERTRSEAQPGSEHARKATSHSPLARLIRRLDTTIAVLRYHATRAKPILPIVPVTFLKKSTAPFRPFGVSSTMRRVFSAATSGERTRIARDSLIGHLNAIATNFQMACFVPLE
jgi:hypothetical protein